MEFRSKYDEHKRFYSNKGNRYKVTYGSKLDQNHNIIVEPKGQEDLYAYINSWADSVDIEVLLKRFQAGDQQALMQRAGSYIDIASLPTNLNEFIEYSASATSFFNTLPIEIKEKFGNNVLEFISSVGTDEWNKIMDTSPAQIDQEYSDHRKAVTKKLKDEVNHVPTVVPSVFDDPKDEGKDVQ